MTDKHHQTLVPGELTAAIEAHARALAAGDVRAAETWVDPRALEAHRAATGRAAEILPLAGFELIARARIGFHYIVKIRFHGAGGGNLPLQNRWAENAAGAWRIVELEDLGLRSPWKKPDKPAAVNTDA